MNVCATLHSSLTTAFPFLTKETLPFRVGLIKSIRVCPRTYGAGCYLLDCIGGSPRFGVIGSSEIISVSSKQGVWLRLKSSVGDLPAGHLELHSADDLYTVGQGPFTAEQTELIPSAVSFAVFSGVHTLDVYDHKNYLTSIKDDQPTFSLHGVSPVAVTSETLPYGEGTSSRTTVVTTSVDVSKQVISVTVGSRKPVSSAVVWSEAYDMPATTDPRSATLLDAVLSAGTAGSTLLSVRSNTSRACKAKTVVCKVNDDPCVIAAAPLACSDDGLNHTEAEDPPPDTLNVGGVVYTKVKKGCDCAYEKTLAISEIPSTYEGPLVHETWLYSYDDAESTKLACVSYTAPKAGSSFYSWSVAPCVGDGVKSLRLYPRELYLKFTPRPGALLIKAGV